MVEDDEEDGATGPKVPADEPADEAPVELETLSQFAHRVGLPVNVVKEANLDNIDERGDVTSPLRMPEDGSN